MRAPRELIDQFHQDRALLVCYDREIAERMRISTSSYCSYTREKLPMTTLFLKKFYTAFQEELSAFKGITGEKEKEPSNSGIGDLKQKMAAIEKLCQDIIENDAKTKQSIQQLSDKIDRFPGNPFPSL